MIPTLRSFFHHPHSWKFNLSKLNSHVTIYLLILCLVSCQHSNESGKDNSQSGNTKLLKLPTPVPITTVEKNRLHASCEHWYNNFLRNSSFNGGMLVAKGGNIIFEQYQGTNPIGSKDSINSETPFHIASVSKTFTAMAVLKLYENGKIHLEDEFSKYFPEFNYPGVTIQSLLSHRSGLPNYLYFMEDLGWNDTVNIQNHDVLNFLINRKAELKNIAPPNSRFNYCNTNYALLALLIEKISGQTYPQFIQLNIFAPLQMVHSFVFTPAEINRATPNYDWRGHPIPNNYLDYVYGDKNIYTTPRDLLIWHRALNNNLFLKAETLEKAYLPYSNERAGIKNYGFGWRMNIYPNGKKVIFHNGWWHGNNAAFIRLPDQDVTIIVLGNRYNRGIYKAYKLINAFADYFEVMDEEE